MSPGKRCQLELKTEKDFRMLVNGETESKRIQEKTM